MNIGDCVAFEKEVIGALAASHGFSPVEANTLAKNDSLLIAGRWATGWCTPTSTAELVALNTDETRFNKQL